MKFPTCQPGNQPERPAAAVVEAARFFDFLNSVGQTCRVVALYFTGMSDESMSNFTPRAQQVLALARKEADRFNHNFLGTEHLLLGLIKLGQGVAVNVLQKMGLDLETVRMEVEKQVGSGPETKMVGNVP